MKESYENTQNLLVSIIYEEHKLQVCSDLKIVANTWTSARLYEILLFPMRMVYQTPRNTFQKERMAMKYISGIWIKERCMCTLCQYQFDHTTTLAH